MASTINVRWRAKLAARLALEAAAKARHTAAQKALTAARQSDTHPRTPLVEARDAAGHTLVLRRAQVEQARRVIARHPDGLHCSPAGAAFIARFEGGASRDGLFRPYRDAVGVKTIGYGHTEGVQMTDKPLTHDQAVKLLLADLDHKYGAITAQQCRHAGYQPGQPQFDALVSFAYNLGAGIIGDPNTSMGGAVARRHDAEIAAAFLLYDKADGRTLPGLERRRQAERKLFTTGRYA